MAGQFANSFFPIFVLMFCIFILTGLLAFYLHVAGFTLIEVMLLVIFPLLADFVFRSQEEKILRKMMKVFREVWQR